MQNRTIFAWLFISAMLLMTTGCKKDNDRQPLSIQQKINPAADLSKLKTWFETNRKSHAGGKQLSAARSISPKDDRRDGIPLWDQTKYYPETGMYVTPMQLSFSNKSELVTTYKYLVAQDNNTADIQSGSFFYLEVDNTKSEQTFKDLLPAKLPAGFFLFQDIPAGFTGALVKYSLNYIYEKGVRYNNSVVSGGRNEIGIGTPGNIITLDKYPESDYAQKKCTDYFLVTFDEDGQIISVKYLYSICEEQDPGAGGGGSGNGNGSGAGGSGGPVDAIPDFCEMDADQAKEVLHNCTLIESFEEANLNIGPESGPDQQGKVRRPNNPIQSLATLDIGFGFSVNYSAYFKGINYKNNPDDFWKWESCVYDYTAQGGGTIPPCMEFDVSNNVSLVTFSADKKNAYVYMAFQIIAKLSCLGGTQLGDPFIGGHRVYTFPAEYTW